MIKKTTLCAISAMVLLFGASALIGCGKSEREQGSEVLDDTKTPAAKQDSAGLFIKAIDAYNGQDMAALIALFDPGVEWVHKTASKTVFQGRAPLAKQLMQERNTFPDCKIGLKRILVEGEELVIQGVFRATHQGVAYGIEPTGKRVSYEFVYFVTTGAGKIKRNIAYLNPAVPLRQMGAISVSEIRMPEWPENVEVVKDAGAPGIEDRVKQFYEMWQTGSFDKLAEVASPNVELHVRATVMSHSNLDGVEQYLKALSSEYKNLKFNIESITSVGSYVAARVVMRGTYRMTPEGAEEPSEKDLELTQTHIFEFERDKLRAVEIYFDELQRYQQFGYSMSGALVQMSEIKKAAVDAGPEEEAPAVVQAKQEQPQEPAAEINATPPDQAKQNSNENTK